LSTGVQKQAELPVLRRTRSSSERVARRNVQIDASAFGLVCAQNDL
jgi:hypothetical protein